MAEVALITAVVALFMSGGAYWRSGGRGDLTRAASQLRAELEALRAKQRELAQNVTESVRVAYEDTKRSLIRSQDRLSELKNEAIDELDRQIDSSIKPVVSVPELRDLVVESEPGATVELEIVRDGRERRMEVELGELEAEGASAARPAGDAAEMGLTLRDVTPEVARRMELDEASGVLVTDVEPGSLAARAGIRPRDVILSANGQKVENVSSFRRIVSEVDLEDGVRMLVKSEGATRFVFVRKLR